MVKEIKDTDFEKEVLKADEPVLVDFWAPWCGPCRAIAPVVEELAEEYGGKVKFAKCNVDENPLTPGKYTIRSIPTILIFKKGELVEEIRGAVPKPKLKASIDKSF